MSVPQVNTIFELRNSQWYETVVFEIVIGPKNVKVTISILHSSDQTQQIGEYQLSKSETNVTVPLTKKYTTSVEGTLIYERGDGHIKGSSLKFKGNMICDSVAQCNYDGPIAALPDAASKLFE